LRDGTRGCRILTVLRSNRQLSPEPSETPAGRLREGALAVWTEQQHPLRMPDFVVDEALAVSRALRGRPCTNDQGRACAVLHEMFADEFARYVGGFAPSMSYYCTTPLLDPLTFAAVMDPVGS
jgi:hypothetical protein